MSQAKPMSFHDRRENYRAQNGHDGPLKPGQRRRLGKSHAPEEDWGSGWQQAGAVTDEAAAFRPAAVQPEPQPFRLTGHTGVMPGLRIRWADSALAKLQQRQDRRAGR